MRGKSESAEKYTFRRDLRESRKAELGRYLGSIDWTFLFSPLESCDERNRVFQGVIQTGLDTIIPLKKVRFNIKEAPWMNPELKSLILKRQSAFHQHGTDSVPFRFYRNLVNRTRKRCKSKFYESRIQHLKNKNPRRWWAEVKRLSGSPSNSGGSVLHHVNIAELDNLPLKEVANVINGAFLEPMKAYQLAEPLHKIPLEQSDAEFLSTV